MNLPVRPDLFIGQDKMLADLRAALAAGSGVVTVTVTGLGGVGKSTLAARYAATRFGGHGVVWWITADTPATIEAGLAALAVAIQPALSRALPLEALREWALQWLACHDGWLLVLDNVNDPADIAPLTGRVATGRFLVTSRLAVGWHAITSSVARLDVLSAENAVELLTRIAPGQADGAEELCTELGCLPLAIEQAGAYLAETAISPRAYLALLARYPAVMFGSAATVGDTGRTIARIWRVTLDWLADDPLAGQILRIVAWYAPDPIPRDLLNGAAEPPDLHRAIGRLAAYSMLTAGDDMTITVHRLVQAVARTADAADPHRAPERIDDARAQATTLLDSAVPPDWADPAAWPTWRTLLPHIDALISHAPDDTDSVTTGRLLNYSGLFLENQGAPVRAIRFLHRALADFVRVLGEDHPRTLSSRNNLAYAYQEAGIWAGPSRCSSRPSPTGGGCWARTTPNADLPEQPRRRLPGGGESGPGHPAVRAGPRRLRPGRGRGPPPHAFLPEQPRLRLPGGGGSGPGYRAVRAGPRRFRPGAGRGPPRHAGLPEQPRRRLPGGGGSGPGHPAVRAGPRRPAAGAGRGPPPTLSSRNNLASTYHAAGDLGRAIPLYEQALADCVRVLGEDHPDTLASRNNLASAYQAAGDLGRAIALFDQALADRRRVLGEDHPGRWPPGTTSPTPTNRRGIWAGPSRCTSRPSPTGGGSWARTTPTRWLPGTTSPPPTRRRGIWAGPSRCSSRPSPTASGSWARTTPAR